MKTKDFFEQLSQSSISLEIVTVMAAMIWNIVFAILFTRLMLIWDRPSLAQQPGEVVPGIKLQPAVAAVESPVMVQGEGWPAGSNVVIYPVAAEASSTVNSAIVDLAG